MKLINRIKGLERRTGTGDQPGPEIIFLRAAGVAGDGDNRPQLQSAIFVGFEREQLHALRGETDEEFSTRAERHFADLQREKETNEQRRNEDGE